MRMLIQRFCLILFCCLGLTVALEGQRYGPQPDARTRAEVLALREAAWRAWFTNDKAAFQRIVPDELIALGWDGGGWGDRDQTLTDMASFATSGMKLETLEFPRTEFQRYGDVILLYTTFRVVLRDSSGALSETAGRGTEVFVRRESRWIHTGWHLDTVSR